MSVTVVYPQQIDYFQIELIHTGMLLLQSRHVFCCWAQPATKVKLSRGIVCTPFFQPLCKPQRDGLQAHCEVTHWWLVQGPGSAWPKYDLPMMLIWCILFQEKNWDVKIWMGRDSNMENKGSASIHLEWHLRASHMPSHPSDVLPLPLNRKSGVGNEKAQSLCILNRFDGRHPGLITCPWEGDLAG